MIGRRALVLALLAAASLLPLTGDALAGLGDLQGTKPGDLAFPDFADADTCANCHGGGVAGDLSFLPSDTWAGTMMANAARDPVFYAALTVANQDAPGIGTYCLRCHSPIGFVQGHATPPDGSAFDATDLQGVGCETCHRATESPPPLGPYLISDAQLFFTEDTAERGPYGDSMSPAHPSAAETGLSDARFCGQCHQVTNPDVHLRDQSGQDTGLEFPLDTTYEEWSASDYGKAGNADFAGCADCHMPRKAGMHPVTRVAGSPMRADPRIHAFTGGNHWGIEAVMAANPGRAAQLSGAFQRAMASTLDTLAKAVKVTLVSAPGSGTPGGPLSVTVRVENQSGHKFPTGYAESRRAWIGISLIDAAKKETTLLGGYDLASGQIQASPPTRVYRAQHGRWDGQAGLAEEHIALHDMVISDSRIPPKGFVPTPATMPSGDIDFSDGTGGLRAFDEAAFTLTAPADAAGDLTLSARVYYQSMTRDHIEFLKAANSTDQRGEDLVSIYQATGEAPPLLIASAEATVHFPGGASSSASAGGGGGGMAGSGGGGGGPPVDSGCGCRVASAPCDGEGAAIGIAIAALILARRRCSPRAAGLPVRRSRPAC